MIIGRGVLTSPPAQHPPRTNSVLLAMIAPLTHGLGFRMPGRFWKDIGMRPMCRAVAWPPGPRLNTTGEVPARARDVNPKGVRVVAVRVEPKTSAHRGHRCLATDREMVAADDDLEAGPEQGPRLGVEEHPGAEGVPAAQVTPDLGAFGDVGAHGVIRKIEEQTGASRWRRALARASEDDKSTPEAHTGKRRHGKTLLGARS